MESYDNEGCKGWFEVLAAVAGAIVVLAAVIAVLFVIWLNGGLNYSFGATAARANVCPPKFEAITLVIEQRRQTVICAYDDNTLINEAIHERGR